MVVIVKLFGRDAQKKAERDAALPMKKENRIIRLWAVGERRWPLCIQLVLLEATTERIFLVTGLY